ncbi:hypothetical protein HMPREF1868_01047 [Olsenella sp. DNF00959]|nr:hypothetical protein HMPREF1868_01047 [Olsenella sp. DNF00959]
MRSASPTTSNACDFRSKASNASEDPAFAQLLHPLQTRST